MKKENERKYGIFTRLRKKELRELEREFTKFLNDTVGMDIREEKTQEVWQWIERNIERECGMVRLQNMWDKSYQRAVENDTFDSSIHRLRSS